MSDEQRIRDLEKELSTEKDTVKKLQENLTALDKKFEGYVKEQQDLESKRLRTALIWAGGVILALGSFIFSEVIWPVIKAGK